MRWNFYVMNAGLILAAAFCFYFVFRRFFELFRLKKGSWGSRVLSGTAGLACGMMTWPVYGFGAVAALCLMAACGITMLLHLLLHRSRWGKSRCWYVLSHSYLPGLLLVGMMLGYGYYNMHHIIETDYIVYSSKLEDGQSLRILAITDLHLGVNMNAARLKEICDEAEKQVLDLVVLGGDIFDESTSRAEMERAAAVLGSINSTYGTFYVFGNHDPNLYRQDPSYTSGELRDTLLNCGIMVLEDEVMAVGSDLAVIGRKDAGRLDRAGIRELAEQTENDRFILLLDHQPVGLETNAAAGIDLQISGHTHGGQMWPTGPVMELFGVNEMNYGIRRIDGLQVVVSSGIAGWGYPLKTGAPCEYVIIDVMGTSS